MSFSAASVLFNKDGYEVITAVSAPSSGDRGLVVRNIPSGTQTVSGTVAASQSGTWNITNISGTVSLPTGASTEGTLSKLAIPQGTTLGSNTQVLQGGSVSASSPTYVAGQISPLSLDTSGALRVNVGAATFSENLAQVNGATVNVGNGTAGTGTQRVVIASDQTAYSINAVQSGTWNLNNISGTVSLPTGAATAAKQPSLGTAGTASSDVITIQGIASMVALKVDGSAVTQPISGTITANAGTGNFTVIQPTGTNLHTVVDSGTITTVSTVTNLSQLAGSAISMNTGVRDAGTQRVTIATNDVVPVSQSGTWNLANITGTVSLPTGASTSAKQPALGTAGSASTDVITIQGIASMTALKVDGSAVTQPISGTITSNIGTTGGLALDATLTGGTATTRLTDGTNTATVKAASTAASAADKALVVAISPNNSVAVTGTFFQATQPISGTITSNIGTTGGLALDSTLAKLTIAQGAVLGSNTQALIGMSVSTGAPTYTSGQISPLSATTAGALRVDNSANTQPVSGTITANAGTGNFSINLSQVAGATTLTGNGVTGTGSQRVTIASDNTAFTVNAAQSGSWSSTVTQATGTNLHTVVDSGTITTVSTVTNLSQLAGAAISMNSGVRDAGTQRVTIATNDSLAVTGTFFQATQPVSGSGNFNIVGTGSDNTTNSSAKLPVLSALAATSSPTWTNGNMVPLSVDTTGALRITGSISATNPSVSATGASPPGSATYVGGSVTTVAPTYSTGQISALSLTTTGLLRVDNSGVTQPVSGTVTANAGTGNFTVAQATGSNLHTVVDSGTLTTVSTVTNLSQLAGSAISMNTGVRDAGTQRVTIATNDSLAVTGTFFQATQPVSGTVTANAGTGNFIVIGSGTDNTTNSTAKLPAMVAVAATSAPTWTNGNMVPLSVDTGGALRIAGTVTANNASISTVATTPPASVTYVGGSVTTGAPTYTTGQANPFSLTTAGALRVDGSSVTQPISGTVTANAGAGNFTVVQASGTNLHTVIDAGTLTTVSTLTNLTQLNGAAISMNTGVRDAGTLRVTVATNDLVPVSQSGTWNINNISGTISLPSGAASEASLAKLTIAQGTSTGTNTQIMAGAVATLAAPTYTTSTINPLSLTTSGFLRSELSSWLGSTAPTIGQKTSANSIPVVIPSDQTISVSTAPSNSVAGFAQGDVTTSSTTQAAVLSTAYAEQSSNAQRSIVSSSALDTNLGGTGARSVLITYYTSTGSGPFTETVNLAGLVAVNTVSTTICFIEEMSVVTVGSGGVNAGIISLKTTTGGGGTNIGTIAVGTNTTLWAHHYVASGKTCNITTQWAGHDGTTVGSGGTFVIKSLPIGVANAAEVQISDKFRLYGQSSSTQRSYGSAIKIVGPARLTTYITPETATSTNYRASFDFYEV